ncbi:MAG: NapC/NirT family cytochrome c [Candidatus Omnitrophota bacterium]|nr:NapC/NirT family cytochrome c [Candidatus Omnitrophota bacterium]
MKRKIIIIALCLVLFLFVALLLLFGFSTSPRFCNSCHIMEPYYQSWKASKHNRVACVDCHYPPSAPQTLLWKKFQAMSQIVKYITRTYSSKPFAEIDDAACLRKGCHSERLLEGGLTFGRGIKFDHRPHFSEPRRGRHLRCVSCHSQIVVGKHLEVTLDTCYLCHFKGMKEGRSLTPLGGCVSCHEPPEKEFEIGNIKYKHKDFVTKHGIECQSCHLDIIHGEGDAPKDRCFTCHNEQEKLEKYTDIPFIHENHVTKHNVACFHCHSEMKHSVKTVTEPLKLDCSKCHIDMHSGQKDIYQGRGGKGVPQMPSPMYLAQVDCVGCHIVEEDGKDGFERKLNGKTFRASEAGCIKCHGEKYAGLVGDWKKELDAAIKAIDPRLKEAQNVLSQISADAPNFTYLKNLYDDARYNYDFVRLSTGIHNIYYSAKLLEKVNNNLDRFSKESKKTLPGLAKAGLLDESYCATLCHAKLGVKIPETVKYKGKDMPHSVHVEAVGACSNCHDIVRHKEMPLKSDLSVCNSCHEGGM